jgi:hypothetical protein
MRTSLAVSAFILACGVAISSAQYPGLIWSRLFAPGFGESVRPTADGGYILVGTLEPFQFYLVKTDEEGDSVWTRSFGVPGQNIGASVAVAADSGYVVVGRTNSFGSGDDDVYVLKVGPSGDSLWARVYGDSGSDGGLSICKTEDDGYVIAGFTSSSGQGSNDIYLLRLNVDGDTV